MREKRRKQKTDPTPDPDASGGPTIVRRKVSVGGGMPPVEETSAAVEEPTADASAATPEAGPDGTAEPAPVDGLDAGDAPDLDVSPAATSAPAATEGADQFDALGNEIAAVLRQARETSERVRTEAGEQAEATRTEAEADARRIVELAEAEASTKLAAAESEIEQQWTAAAQQLEEATKALELAREQDRTLRQDAADHLAHALAARDAGTEILAGATRQIERAEAAARDLESHAEAARMEAAQIAFDLHELAEHFGSGSGVIDLRADAVPPVEPAADAAAEAEADADAATSDLPAPPPSAP